MTRRSLIAALLAGNLIALPAVAQTGPQPELPKEPLVIVTHDGKRHPFKELRDWFKSLYAVLLGQDQGPRFGSFIALYGRKETADLIRRALAGENLAG